MRLVVMLLSVFHLLYLPFPTIVFSVLNISPYTLIKFTFFSDIRTRSANFVENKSHMTRLKLTTLKENVVTNSLTEVSVFVEPPLTKKARLYLKPARLFFLFFGNIQPSIIYYCLSLAGCRASTTFVGLVKTQTGKH